VTGQGIGTLAVTPRPLADYRTMFSLTDSELRAGPLLDCAAGASPFGAQVRLRGGSVVSADPLYTVARDELVELATRDAERIADWVAANPEAFDWDYLGAPGPALRAWELAIDLFARDYEPDGRRYVAASLPSLPFPDGYFRLAVSGYYLFSYPAQVTFDGHIAAIAELVRVTAGEVRLCPLIDTATTEYPRLPELRAALHGIRIRTEIRTVPGAYQPGGNRALICWRPDTASR
jgi:hypothetical protein